MRPLASTSSYDRVRLSQSLRAHESCPPPCALDLGSSSPSPPPPRRPSSYLPGSNASVQYLMRRPSSLSVQRLSSNAHVGVGTFCDVPSSPSPSSSSSRAQTLPLLFVCAAFELKCCTWEMARSVMLPPYPHPHPRPPRLKRCTR
jgi:hypothetical protein